MSLVKRLTDLKQQIAADKEKSISAKATLKEIDSHIVKQLQSCDVRGKTGMDIAISLGWNENMDYSKRNEVYRSVISEMSSYIDEETSKIEEMTTSLEQKFKERRGI